MTYFVYYCKLATNATQSILNSDHAIVNINNTKQLHGYPSTFTRVTGWKNRREMAD